MKMQQDVKERNATQTVLCSNKERRTTGWRNWETTDENIEEWTTKETGKVTSGWGNSVA